MATRPREELPLAHSGTHVEGAPVCPWREPVQDLPALFPGSTGYREETRILSSARLELTRRLGHTPTGDDNALRVYRVRQGETPVGSVIVRRVRGEYGAIELVIGVRPDGAVHGVRIQRSREPATIDAALHSPGWLARFRDRKAESDWKSVGAAVPAVARPSAAGIAEGVRTGLVLLETANRIGLTTTKDPR